MLFIENVNIHKLNTCFTKSTLKSKSTLNKLSKYWLYIFFELFMVLVKEFYNIITHIVFKIPRFFSTFTFKNSI